MLSCKETVKIVSSEEPSSWRKQVQVRFHLLMCSHCRRYVKQLELVRGGISSLLISRSEQADAQKIRELEDKVLEKISEKHP